MKVIEIKDSKDNPQRIKDMPIESCALLPEDNTISTNAVVYKNKYGEVFWLSAEEDVPRPIGKVLEKDFAQDIVKILPKGTRIVIEV